MEALAVHLLRRGETLKSIGDVLSHRSPEMTFIYTKLHVEDLRTVAMDPEVALAQALAAAQEGTSEPIVSLIEDAIAHDKQPMIKQRARMRTKTLPGARGEASRVDYWIDRALSSISARLTGNVDSLPPDDPS